MASDFGEAIPVSGLKADESFIAREKGARNSSFFTLFSRLKNRKHFIATRLIAVSSRGKVYVIEKNLEGEERKTGGERRKKKKEKKRTNERGRKKNTREK